MPEPLNMVHALFDKGMKQGMGNEGTQALFKIVADSAKRND